MTIYTFNLLVGYEPNGVDVAQASRALMLRELNEPAKFILRPGHNPEIRLLSFFGGIATRNSSMPTLAFYRSRQSYPIFDSGGLAAKI